MDSLTSFLFSFFPREVGNPHRKIVNTINEFEKFINLNNGINPVFTSLYDINQHIDKVWVEIDAPSIMKAIEKAREIIKKIEQYDIPFVPVFSGMKGFHFYLLFKPWVAPNIDTMKFIIRKLQEMITNGIGFVDTHSFGNVRALVRVPNTMNRTNYCTYLPHDFVDWSIRKIVRWAKEPHKFKPKDFGLRIVDDVRNFLDFEVCEHYEVDYPEFPKMDNLPSNLKYLSNLIRPCLIPYFQNEKEPCHIMRVNLVSELMWLDFTEEQIHNLIKNMGWIDYDERITKYQINNIFKNRTRPMSCKNLKRYVKCFKCGWRYCWK